MTATSAPVDWGTAASVAVKVAAAPAPVTGVVELREGGTVRGSATPADGGAVFPLPPGLAAGVHNLTVAYSGSDLLEAAQYEAKWWNRNQAPGDPGGPWKLIG